MSANTVLSATAVAAVAYFTFQARQANASATTCGLCVTAIGYAAIAYVLYNLVWWVYVTFLYKADLNKYRAKSGKSWALVTGSTDGIGLAFAKELARRKFNVILLSRNKGKLENCQAEILKEFADKGVEVKYIVADAENTDAKTFEAINAGVVGIVGAADAANSDNHLVMLVNNVGIANQPIEPINEQPLNSFESMLTVNCTFPAKLTVLLTPFLLRNKRSAMINVSSFSCRVPVPFLATYAATKAFNAQFSRCVEMELRSRGCDVLGITPAYVASSMTGTSKVNLARCSAKVCAVGALNKMGLIEASPYWFHSLQELVSTKVLPRFILDNMLTGQMKASQTRERRMRAEKAAGKPATK